MSVAAPVAFRAPGRVNLIGDHTDYNDGFVLPLALELECVVRGAARGDGAVVLRSREVAGEVRLAADGSTGPTLVDGWGRYAAGVVRVLAGRGRAPVGLEADVSSTVPVGAGLSSSAALEVSLALALCAVAGLELGTVELAQACREAEELATGVPCGIMDQLASLAGRAGCALLIDCRSLGVDPVPIPPALAVLVVHSGVSRSLDATSYAERRAACEAIAARLGLPALRDAAPDQVAGEPYARHVVSENARVLDAARALAAGDASGLGRLLSESHASLRDDYAVSTPELDTLVRLLEEAGALGARLTGAGFGGCVVAVAHREDAERVTETAVARYESVVGLQASVYPGRAAAGAGPADVGPEGAA